MCVLFVYEINYRGSLNDSNARSVLLCNCRYFHDHLTINNFNFFSSTNKMNLCIKKFVESITLSYLGGLNWHTYTNDMLQLISNFGLLHFAIERL